MKQPLIRQKSDYNDLGRRNLLLFVLFIVIGCIIGVLIHQSSNELQTNKVQERLVGDSNAFASVASEGQAEKAAADSKEAEEENPGAAERKTRADAAEKAEEEYRKAMAKRMKEEEDAMWKMRGKKMEEAEEALQKKYPEWYPDDGGGDTPSNNPQEGGSPNDDSNVQEGTPESAIGGLNQAIIKRLGRHAPKVAVTARGVEPLPPDFGKAARKYRDPEAGYSPEGKPSKQTFQKYRDPEASHTNPFHEWGDAHKLRSRPRQRHPDEHQREVGRSDLSDYDEVGVSEDPF